MSATETLEKPKTSGPGNKIPPLKHLVCKCQENLEKGSLARCGARVGGPVTWMNRAATREFTVCVVCRMMYETKAPCPLCGK